MHVLTPYSLGNTCAQKCNWRGGKWSAKISPQFASSAAFLNALPVPRQPRRTASGPGTVQEHKKLANTACHECSRKHYLQVKNKTECTLHPPRCWATHPAALYSRERQVAVMVVSRRNPRSEEEQFLHCCWSNLSQEEYIKVSRLVKSTLLDLEEL